MTRPWLRAPSPAPEPQPSLPLRGAALLAAQNVNEHCELMPATPDGVTFTNVTVNGVAKPAWTTRANCAGNPSCDCGNQASVDPSTGDVTLSWKAGAVA